MPELVKPGKVDVPVVVWPPWTSSDRIPSIEYSRIQPVIVGIENIIEDGLNDFFFTHIYKYKESWTHPINFIGSIAFGFKDVLQELCNSYELELGKVQKAPMKGLIDYHS